MAHINGVVPMMLSTPDNPYNPFENFDDWYACDEARGHHTCSYIARLTFDSPAFSDDMNQVAINDAVERIYAANPKGMYIIYYKDGKIRRENNELERSLMNDAGLLKT
jgi:hypothetical protein